MFNNDVLDINSKVKNSPKYLPGIDAIYFYVKVNLDDYSIFYRNFLLAGVLENDDNLEKLSLDYTKQWTFFDYKINISSEGFSPHSKSLCSIAFKNLNDRDNLDSILIQMDTQMLNYLGYKKSTDKVLEFITTLGLRIISTKVSRVDLNTYVLDYNFDYLTVDYFSTKSSKSTKTFSVENRGVLETFTLGSRSTDAIYLRIYNKNKELRHLSTKDWNSSFFKECLINSKFSYKYKQEIDVSNHDLWNVEFEIKRGVLRRYKIETLNDLYSNVDSIHKDICVNNFRLLEKKKNSNNNQRVNTSMVWQRITNEFLIIQQPTKIEKEKLQVYKKNDKWLLNRLTEFLEEKNNNNHIYKQEILDLISKLSSKS